jgi:hypothetical protein
MHVQEAAQLGRAEPAFEKHGIGGFRLRQGEISRDGAGARQRTDRLLCGFGDSRIAVAPQERVADADANPGQVARANLRDKAGRIDPGRIKLGKPEDHVGDAARQQPRRVEGEGQRYDAFGSARS